VGPHHLHALQRLLLKPCQCPGWVAAPRRAGWQGLGLGPVCPAPPAAADARGMCIRRKACPSDTASHARKLCETCARADPRRPCLPALPPDLPADNFNWCAVPLAGSDAFLFVSLALLAAGCLFGKLSAVWVLVAGAPAASRPARPPACPPLAASWGSKQVAVLQAAASPELRGHPSGSGTYCHTHTKPCRVSSICRRRHRGRYQQLGQPG
jgi:hypothetical protein